MFWTVLVFLSMLVVGGGIAYSGDLLGRKIGKKRIKLFGMRPKHTAIFITSLTGSFVVLLSTLALLAVAPTVREVVLRGEATIREYDRQKVAFAKELAVLKSNVAQAQSQTTEANRRLVAARNEVGAKQNAIQGLKKHQAQLVSDVAVLQARSQTLGNRNAKLTLANNELEKQSDLYQHQNAGLGKQTIELARQNDRLIKQNENMRRQSAETLTKLAQMEADTVKLEAQKAALTTRNTDLTRQNEVLERVGKDLNDANQKDIERANAQIRLLANDIDALVKDRKELLTFLSGAKDAFSDYLNLRVQRIAFPSGEVVARQTLEISDNREEMKKSLHSLLQDASAMAQLKGARRGDNGLAVRLVNNRYVPGAQDESAVVDGLLDELCKSKSGCIVMATTVANTTEGEPALVRLSYLPVRPTFKRGDVIATRVVNTNRPLEALVGTVVQFLQEDVRNAAVEAGTIPQLDKSSGTTQVGIFGAAELVDLTDRLRKMGGEVEITAIAERNLNSIDPLRLKFRLVRPKNRV